VCKDALNIPGLSMLKLYESVEEPNGKSAYYYAAALQRILRNAKKGNEYECDVQHYCTSKVDMSNMAERPSIALDAAIEQTNHEGLPLWCVKE
jgi:hypothetical protein